MEKGLVLNSTLLRIPVLEKVTNEPKVETTTTDESSKSQRDLLNHERRMLQMLEINSERWEQLYEVQFGPGVEEEPLDTGEVKAPEFAMTPEKMSQEMVDFIVGSNKKLDAPDDYMKKCAEVGYMPPQLEEQMFYNFVARFMQRNEFSIYPEDKVNHYLSQLCKQALEGRRLRGAYQQLGDRYDWEYKPLRECDRLKSGGGAKLGGKSVHCAGLFSEVIPVEALDVVSRMSAAWEGQVKDTPFKDSTLAFEATEIKFHPDPFLRAKFVRRNNSLWVKKALAFVVFHWDEPGFSISK